MHLLNQPAQESLQPRKRQSLKHLEGQQPAINNKTINKDQNISVFFMNVQSIRNKTTYMNDHIASCKYDIAVLCETWLNATDESDQVCVNGMVWYGNILFDKDN